MLAFGWATEISSAPLRFLLLFLIPPSLRVSLCADISELDLPNGATITFPEGKDKIMNFEIVLKPDEGLYK